MTDVSIQDGTGEVYQSCMMIPKTATRASNKVRDELGIVLDVRVSDDKDNRFTSQFEDAVSSMHVARVLVVEDGHASCYTMLNDVVIPPNQPSGIDNYEEFLPRGSSAYLSGQVYDTSLQGDVHDLDGDWCVIRYIGGSSARPYIASYWPHPRNVFDPQTSGQGAPVEGVGTTLNQTDRSFKRVNGVETTVTSRGDTLISTHYAGSSIVPGGAPERGRFARALVDGGGHIGVNMKPSGLLHLNWNEERDGIGPTGSFDPSVQQKNPLDVRPTFSGDNANTKIQISKVGFSVDVPSGIGLFSRGTMQLSSSSDSGIIVGGVLGIQVDDFFETTVVNDVYVQSEKGNMVHAVGELKVQEDAEEEDEDFREIDGSGHFQMWTENDWKVEAENGDIELLADLGGIIATATVGNITATAPLGSITLDATALDIALSANTGIALSTLIGPISLSAGGVPDATPATITLTPEPIPGLGGLKIELGGDTEAVILGNTYATVEDTFLTALDTYLGLCTGPTGDQKATIKAAIAAFQLSLAGGGEIASVPIPGALSETVFTTGNL